MSDPEHSGGGHLCQAPTAHETIPASQQETARRDRSDPERAAAASMPLPSVPGDAAAIRGVISSDDATLRRVLRADRAVRHALRWRPGDGGAEQARTLVAAARVERRRRAGAGVLGEVLAAARPGGAR